METIQPKLRFTEFRKNWLSKNLGSFADVSKLAGYEFTKHIQYEEKGKIIALRGLNIKNNSLDLTEVKYIDNSELDKLSRSKLYINDIMFTYIGTIGEVALITENDRFYLAPNVSRLRITNDEIIPSFILQYFNTRKMKDEEIAKYVSSSSQPALTMESVRKFEFQIPSFEEQTKIANFLSSVDEKLNLFKEKKALLEDYKKGIMQKIFNQEIRFKDDNGNDFEDWEEKTITEICTKIQSGGTPKSTNKDYYDGNIPFLSIADMTKQGKYIEYTSNSISEYGLKNSSSWIVPVNSIIYSMYASVGFVAINKIPIATSQAVLNLILKQDICIDYIYYFLLDFQKYLAEYITTGTQGNLNAQTVKGFVIPIPSNKEQNKIANFLSAIDEKLELVTNQIQDTQEYKKGLLQQMFV